MFSDSKVSSNQKILFMSSWKFFQEDSFSTRSKRYNFNLIQNKGHFEKNEIKTFMKGLLEGLTHMHENRIMHRDLKP